jgi:hypothetical protein
MGTHAAREQGVAVRVRGCHAGAADRTTSPADVLDHHRLPEDFPHLLRHDARHNIARTASGERHHYCDGSRWIALRVRVVEYGKQTQGRDAD